MGSKAVKDYKQTISLLSSSTWFHQVLPSKHYLYKNKRLITSCLYGLLLSLCNGWYKNARPQMEMFKVSKAIQDKDSKVGPSNTLFLRKLKQNWSRQSVCEPLTMAAECRKVTYPYMTVIDRVDQEIRGPFLQIFTCTNCSQNVEGKVNK